MTGTHLSPEFGLTVDEIEADGLYIDRSIEMLLSSDTCIGLTKSFGLASIGFADALSQLNPDVVLVLGDRFEILSAVTSSLFANIPVAHCHGGELTEASFDDSIRHSITKMSQLHFVATEEYRQRVIQLGEQPTSVFTVGGLGFDSINNLKLYLVVILSALDFKFQKRNLIVTYHPVTADKKSCITCMEDLLSALSLLLILASFLLCQIVILTEEFFEKWLIIFVYLHPYLGLSLH